MVGSLNKVTLIGNLGTEPEVKSTQDGNKIVSFSLATSENWKDKSGERQEKTEWHRVVCFSQGLCDVIEKWVHKGTKLYIEGQLRTRKWQDASGVDKYTTEVVLSNFNASMIILDSRNGGDSAPAAGGSSFDASSAKMNDIDDDIPF